MNRKFKRNLILGFGVSLLLLLVSVIASFISIRSLVKSAGWVNHTHTVMLNLEQLFSYIKDAETGQRGYLLTRDPSFLTPYNGTEKKITAALSELQDLTSDNQTQQENIKALRQAVQQRLNRLQKRIDELNNLGTVDVSSLADGQVQMNRVRAIIEAMSVEEQRLLKSRTEDAKDVSQSTLLLIVVASVLSLAIAIAFFLRVMADFSRREALQQELEQKDQQIHQRLTIISGIASQVSAGNYDVRVGDEGKDVLGTLAGSLDTMAGSLRESFSRLSQNEWLQTGVAALNDAMIGEKNMETLCGAILNQVTEYSRSQWGAFYLSREDQSLQLISGYALQQGLLGKTIQVNEELAGQSAYLRKILYLEGPDTTSHPIAHTGGNFQPRNVVAIPIQFEGKLKGVIELASTEPYAADGQRRFFRAVATNTGIALNAARNRQRVQELLEETQAQAEELQVQHGELENINTELEAQAEKLQASEEELRVQQEELQQANAELEERSRLLEERNNLILERNLEIQTKAEELEQSTRYKSEFLANMSHELRTPLNSILLLSRLLSENHDGNLSSDQVEYAKVIQGSGNGLLTLIDEILDLSKIESGKMELEYQQVGVAEIVRDLRNLFEPLAKEKGIAFSIATNPDVPGQLETDKLRVEQVLRNLLSNALKFTGKGSVQLAITLEDEQVLFAVKDTGIGIPAAKQESIFEAFKQADGSTRRKYGGTGLGLSISRELARLLGGEILLHSEEGKGSTFTLRLPTTQPQPSTAAEVREAVVVPEKTKAPTPATAVPAKNTAIIPEPVPDDRQAIKPGDRVLLIIEDDTGFARSLLDYTRRKGYKGLVAVRGDEGIELAMRYKPAGILLDVQLPVKSGWEVMEALKGNGATRHIPVHMMSALQVKHKSLSAGAIDFIDKPVAFEQLSGVFQKIEEALSRHPRKVLIVEENTKHAEALALFLEHYNVQSQIRNTVDDGITALSSNEADCVILDMGVPGQNAYKTLEEVKRTPGLEHIPIIIFTGRNLSHQEEGRIKQYADSIVIKTAHSYQRILDEVSLFLHLVEEQGKEAGTMRRKPILPREILQGKKVLIADDDVRNIFSLTKLLEQNGIEVLSAMDGRDALNQLQASTGVDLVLLDMMMPEMDGYETAREIRRQAKWRNLPIIAVTAKAMTGDRERCIDAGASDYITKPVDADQLISLLRVWLYQ